MPTVTEGNLSFFFPGAWAAEKYDQLPFYTKAFQHVLKAKAVDILAVEPTNCCWLIEIKDYRQGHQTNAVTLATQVAEKVRDTLAGMASARVRATGRDQSIAHSGMTCGDLRIVLHMEHPPLTSALFTRAIDPANVQTELKRLIRAIDPRLQVVDIQTSLHLPWTVQ